MIYRKVPTIVWGSFAVIGILFVGLTMGFTAGSDYQYSPTSLEKVREQNDKYLDLIEGYEIMSQLEAYQDENVRIVADRNMADDHPGEFYEALTSLTDYRDRILIQSGKIIELRRQAGLLASPAE